MKARIINMAGMPVLHDNPSSQYMAEFWFGNDTGTYRDGMCALIVLAANEAVARDDGPGAWNPYTFNAGMACSRAPLATINGALC